MDDGTGSPADHDPAFADPQEEIVGVLMKQTQGANDDTAWRFRLLVGQAVDD
ncbi:MAG: hypothetical protein KJ072_06985 [Verrucomicrobia bacterium]|nr:hypothetical protein [Verrucomicrobiota bacterium]